MLQRRILAVLFAVTLFAVAPSPKPIAPDKIEHGNALFLRSLSADGKRRVQFKAMAVGKYFFLEEPAGVTVYEFDGKGYRKVELLKNATLENAVKKYGKK
jgi:hypothetical protein